MASIISDMFSATAAADWEQKTGFPMVVGAVDGTHIPIMQPHRNSQDYYSYKMKYTINVQGCF